MKRAFLPLSTVIPRAVSKEPGGARTASPPVLVGTGAAAASPGLCPLAPAIISQWIQPSTDR